MQNLNESHWEAFQRIFSYLKGTPNKNLTYKRSAEGLIGYTNANWIKDRNTRRFTSGYIFLMQEALISWRSKRQEYIILLIAEAEYIAATEITKEALFLKGIINTLLPINQQINAITIKENNKSCIRIRYNPEFHQRTKYIDLKYYFIRNHINKNEIILEWISRCDQLADELTKPLSKAAFDTFIRRIKLINRSFSESD
jgi:hypothetical protein